MRRSIVPVVLGACLALAGCTALNSNEPLNPNQADPAEPAPPEASLDANRTAGPAPLNVTFTADATSEADASMAWTLDPGDGSPGAEGEATPATRNHTYEQPGTYDATLEVEQANRTDTATVRITVEAAEDAESGSDDGSGSEDEGEDDGADGDAGDGGDGADEQVPDPVEVTGEAVLGHPVTGLNCVRQGIDGAIHEIAPAGPGWAYQLAPADGFDVYWWSDDAFLEAGDDQGTVPDEATRAEVCAQTGTVDATYTLTLWHPDDPDGP